MSCVSQRGETVGDIHNIFPRLVVYFDRWFVQLVSLLTGGFFNFSLFQLVDLSTSGSYDWWIYRLVSLSPGISQLVSLSTG